MTWPHDQSQEERIERSVAERVAEIRATYNVRRELADALVFEASRLNDEGMRVLVSLVARLVNRGAEPIDSRIRATLAWLQARDGEDEGLAW